MMVFIDIEATDKAGATIAMSFSVSALSINHAIGKAERAIYLYNKELDLKYLSAKHPMADSMEPYNDHKLTISKRRISGNILYTKLVGSPHEYKP